MIVEDMRDDGGDAPIGDSGFELVSIPVAITVFSYPAMARHFTHTVAESVLRGLWDLMACYGFFTLHIEIFIGAQLGAFHAGQLLVELRQGNSTATSLVPVVNKTSTHS